MVAECGECGAVVDSEVCGSYVDDQDESGTYGKYTLLKCTNCRSPILVLQTDASGDWDSPLRIYPSDKIRTDYAIPNEIVTAYLEARTCFRAKAYTAAAIMCRKTLQGVIEAHDIKTRNLAQGLRELKEKGLIENRLYEWADALRMSGNEAAHDVNVTTSAQDARDILEFTNAILEYIFTFRVKFEGWKKRRENRQKAGIAVSPTPAPDEE
jgi:hypothetical protein